ncbi:hypothetical protein D779_0378 [Imhoffiella purpurea]|uniref:Uncharacterized protein n=1 Tax=Imhoffiella purpurea TaxID=1249627 RepID=W9VGT9_9GAMM|nr:hypothetical protein D779_0378 [Imhoffiella purpurea]
MRHAAARSPSDGGPLPITGHQRVQGGVLSASGWRRCGR